MPREFRNVLGTNYHDIDIKNCHPEILCQLHSQYCSKNGIKCDILGEYIKNRNEILKTVGAGGKTLFLKIMNGGKVEIDNDFLIKFRDDIKLIHKNVCALNQEIFKSIKLRKEYNTEGSMMNVILC